MSITWLSETLYITDSSIDNLGIFTACPLYPGETIYRVTGKFIRNEFSAAFAKMGPNWIGVSKEMWLDPDPTNPMTFMNHSCEPNSIVTEGLKVVALRSIAANEEILMDYSTTEIDPYWQMACTCNTLSCRKTIRSFQFLPNELRNIYEPRMLKSLVAALAIPQKRR